MEKYGYSTQKNQPGAAQASGCSKERGYKEMKKKRSASCKDKNTGELLTKKPGIVK